MITRQHFDDPVAAYNFLAPHYSDLSRRRQLYLRSIEKIMVSRIPAGSKSLLDIGAGDGKRALRMPRNAEFSMSSWSNPAAKWRHRLENWERYGISVQKNWVHKSHMDLLAQFEVRTAMQRIARSLT